MPRKPALVALVALAAASLACSGGLDVKAQPVPADKLDYIGQWEGGSVDLEITPDGTLVYENSGEGSSGSMTAPILEWKEDGFAAGVSILRMDFHVDEAPHQEEGAWKMTVDGTELVRVGEGAPAAP